MAAAIGIENYGGADFARIVATPVASGQTVKAGKTVFEVENHKVTQEIEAPAAGRLAHALKVGDLVRLGTPVAFMADADEDLAPLEAASAQAVLTDEGADAPGEPLSVLKSTELTTLGSGAAHSMMSTLGAHVGPILRRKDTKDFYRQKILDLLTFEASRLLAGRYARLNAYFSEGRVFAREAVCAGVAFDDGGRLTVCAIENSDKLSLPDTQDAILDGLMRYMGKALVPAQTAGATFTISDLSASKLTFSFPLLPRGQCIIIAVLRNEAGDYSLIISFDHRVTEGLLVSAFLTELVERLRSFSQTADEAAPPFTCSFCEKSLAEEIGPFGGKGLLKLVDGDGKDALCCSACWGGW